MKHKGVRMLALVVALLTLVLSAGPIGAAVRFGHRVAISHDDPTPTTLSSSSPTTSAPTTSSVSLVLKGGDKVAAGTRFIAVASTNPPVAGRIVQLQRMLHNKWRNVAVLVTNTKGQANFRVHFAASGPVRLQATLPATALYSAATSRSRIERVLPPPPSYANANLAEGASGPEVTALQQRLTELGYWVGTPNGNFGDATEQAVYAIQKAAGIARTGVVDAATVNALVNGVQPTPRSASGYVIEVDLQDDLVMFVNNGKLEYTLNTSTGGGYTYYEDGEADVATTPTGIFHIERAVDGIVTDSLGSLWRPRFFYEGYAIHGDSYVPPEPVSHGCVRVSDEAIDWIWSANLAPIGTEVWVY